MFLRHTTVIFLIGIAICAGTPIPDFESYCTLISPVLTLLPEVDDPSAGAEKNPPKTIDFDLAREYEKEESKFIGQGTSGKVVTLTLPLDKPLKVAVKKIKVTGSTPEELYLTRLMGRSKLGPKLISCQHEPTTFWPITMYIVISLGHWDLDSQEARKAMKKMSLPQRVQIYKKMLTAMRVLWSHGFMHNDIKPANFIADEKMSLIWLIDYGSVSQVTEPLPINGSPPFISPGKFQDGEVSPVHDLYSWAVSVAYLESDVSRLQDSSLLHDDESYWKIVGLKGRLPQSCFVGPRADNCRSKLVRNAKRIMTDRGFGPFVERSDKKFSFELNLTTLICEIIWFEGFSATFEEIEALLSLIMSELTNRSKEGKMAEQTSKKLVRI